MQYVKLQLRKLGEVKLGFFVLLVGVLLGFIFSRALKGFYMHSMDILNQEYLHKVRDTAIVYPVLLKYVLWNIFRSFLLFWVICTTAFGVPYIVFCLLYGGFQCGFFISAVFMRFGLKGMLLILGYTFPQYIIYIPVIFLCLRSGYRLCKSMHYELKMSRRGRVEKVARHLILIFLFGILLIFGGLLETYAGSFVLKKILLLF